MAFCSKCGFELKEKVKFCPNCGNEIDQEKNKNEYESKIVNCIKKILDTKDSTKDFTKKDIKDNMGFALVSYLSILAFIPYFLGKSSKFVQYHAKQGMNLLIVTASYTVFSNLLCLIRIGRVSTYLGTYVVERITPWWITLPVVIGWLCLILITVVGIVNVSKGRAKELPIIGKLKIVK